MKKRAKKKRIRQEAIAGRGSQRRRKIDVHLVSFARWHLILSLLFSVQTFTQCRRIFTRNGFVFIMKIAYHFQHVDWGWFRRQSPKHSPLIRKVMCRLVCHFTGNKIQLKMCSTGNTRVDTLQPVLHILRRCRCRLPMTLFPSSIYPFHSKCH